MAEIIHLNLLFWNKFSRKILFKMEDDRLRAHKLKFQLPKYQLLNHGYFLLPFMELDNLKSRIKSIAFYENEYSNQNLQF
jgi:hypothetical protein